MKFMAIYLFLFTGFILVSCSSNKKKPSGIKKQQSTEIIATKPQEPDSTLYQSVRITGSEVLFVVIDPHGNGKLAVSKFQKVAKELNVNVIGLNNVANNSPGYIELIDKDIRIFGGGPKTLIVAGFSGGARMAYQYALKKQVNGVIMCGAGPGQMMNRSLPFPLVLMAGTRDFNFVEQYYPPASAITRNANLLTIPFEGKHEWPGETNILLASKFILAKLNINQKLNGESSTINQQFKIYQDEGKLFLAFKQLEALSKIIPDNSQKEKLTAFIKSPDFIKYMDHYQGILAEEMKRNRQLMKDLSLMDLQWWNKTIDEINMHADKPKNRLESDSWARTKAFLGVLMYSVVSREISQTESPNLNKYLKIYEKLEPDNPDLKKFKKQATGKS